MSSKGKQRMESSLGRELSVALEGSIASGKDAAVRAAEKARDDAQGAARAALEHAQAAAKQSSKDKLAIAAMLEEHALETRGVVLCAGIALLELVPLLLWLYIALFG